MPGAGLRQRLAALLRRPVAADTGAVLLTIVAVQGLVPLAQLGAAALLPPEAFGALRTAESVLGVTLLLGALGMPTLAITGSARLASVGERAALARRIGLVALVAAILTLLMLELTAPAIVADAAGVPLLRALGPVIVIGALGRSALGFAQGTRRLGPLAVGTLAAAVPALVLLLALTSAFGVRGWVVGRLLGELLLLGAALFVVRDLVLATPAPTASADLAPRRLASGGAIVSLSLLTRGAVDAVALLAAGHAGLSAADVGVLGLGTLLLTGLLLPGVAVYAAMLPRLVLRRDVRGASQRLVARMVAAGVGVTALSALVLLVVGPFALRWLGAPYRDAGPVLALVVAVAPLRALTGAGGNVLLAQHWIGAGLMVNVAGLALLALAMRVAVPAGGLAGAAGAMLVAEGLAALAMIWVATRALPRPRVDEPVREVGQA